MAERMVFALMFIVGGLAVVDLSYALGLDLAAAWVAGAIISIAIGGALLRIHLRKTRLKSHAEDRI